MVAISEEDLSTEAPLGAKKKIKKKKNKPILFKNGNFTKEFIEDLGKDGFIVSDSDSDIDWMMED
jgi:hypothetical protein